MERSDAIGRGRLSGLDMAAVVLTADAGGRGTFYDLAVVRVERGSPSRLPDRPATDRLSSGRQMSTSRSEAGGESKGGERENELDGDAPHHLHDEAPRP